MDPYLGPTKSGDKIDPLQRAEERKAAVQKNIRLDNLMNDLTRRKQQPADASGGQG